MPLIIKRRLIDENNPLICVPLVERTHEDIVDTASRLVAKRVDMVEWRADYYENLNEPEELLRTLQALRGILNDTVFLCTVRTENEGGKVSLPTDEMEELLLSIAKAHCADLIDVEYFQYPDARGLISKLQGNGASIIASHHDFNKTNPRAVSARLLEEMATADPDIIKLCYMPSSKEDVFELASAATRFNKDNPGLPLIMISMSDLGVISRIAPGAFCSCVSFGTVEKASAPGQVEYDKLRELIEFSKKYYN